MNLADFPLWKTVYDHYRNWCLRGVWQKVLDDLAKLHRRKFCEHCDDENYISPLDQCGAIIDVAVKAVKKGDELFVV